MRLPKVGQTDETKQHQGSSAAPFLTDFHICYLTKILSVFYRDLSEQKLTFAADANCC